MCGFIARFSAGPARPFPLGDLSGLLHHRGPDAAGAIGWQGDGQPERLAPSGTVPHSNVMLHRRLSIIDLDEQANQPFRSENGRYWLVYNGEIYNYLELREQLCGLGDRFRTQSDTEVLLKAWALWGPDCLDKLEGMFAFAIYDRQRGRVFAARDGFGIKPLFLHRQEGELLFSSELAPIAAYVGPNHLDTASAAYAMRWGMNDGHQKTIIPETERIPPGSFVEVDLADLSVIEPKVFFDPRTIEIRDWDYAEAVTALRDTFMGSVERHLRSDAKLGFALSGGIDSSAIVCAAHALGHEQPETFSYVPANERLSERKWIDIVADWVGARTHFIRPGANLAEQNLGAVVRHQGEPFASLSIYAQYEVYAEVARQNTKVLLSGQGADELLAGYISYYQAAVMQAFYAGELATAFARLRRLSKTFGIGVGTALRWLARTSLPEGLKNRFAKRQFGLMAPWADTSRMSQCGMTCWADLHEENRRSDSVRDLLIDSMSQSLVALLRYDDRNSMAHSVESRVPFLTPDLARLCFSFPDSFFIDKTGLTKKIFRDAMRGIVPQAILNRRDKIGFAPDNSTWSQALRSFELGERDIILDGLIDGPALRSAVARGRHEDASAFGFLWRSSNLAALERQYLGAGH